MTLPKLICKWCGLEIKLCPFCIITSKEGQHYVHIDNYHTCDIDKLKNVALVPKLATATRSTDYFKDGTPVEIYEKPEGTYVNDLDTRTNN